MPTMTQATHAQIDINKQNITSLNTPKAHVSIEGLVPTLTLGMKTGGAKRADILFRDKETDKVRATIQYVQNGALGAELILETRDSAGALQNILLMGENGHIINPTSGETITSENDLVTAKMLTEPFRLKADLNYVDSSVINEFSGVIPPLPQTGKSNDVFHQYPTQVDTTIQDGLALHDYNLSYFPLYQNSAGPNGITEISISANNREVSMYFTATNKPVTDSYILEINGNDIPLTVIYNTASGFIGYYSAIHDGKIQSIAQGTPFRMRGMILGGARTDWVKSGSTWFLRPIFNNTYDHDTAKNVIITDTAFIDLASLNTTRDAGLYEIKFSKTFKYSSKTNSAIFRWSLDGGTSWETFPIEVKDTTNVHASSYVFPYMHSGGAFDIRMQATCENNGQTLDIKYANIIVERKG